MEVMGWREFYKTFGNILAILLLVFKKSVIIGELPAWLKRGVIALLLKSNKDKLYLENWRPIGLLNNDTKIYSLILAKRIKKSLNMIIDQEQSGFLKGRFIGNNIRWILDLIDYNHFILDDNLILFIHFYKAFDTIEHSFMFKVIKFFGFSIFFFKMQFSCISLVQLSHGTCPRFKISRGIRQGCPISPFLFY